MTDKERINARAKEIRDLLKVAMIANGKHLNGRESEACLAMMRDTFVLSMIHHYALSEHVEPSQFLAEMAATLWIERDQALGALAAVDRKCDKCKKSGLKLDAIERQMGNRVVLDYICEDCHSTPMWTWKADCKPIQLESSIKPEGHRVIYGDKSPKFNGVPITAEKAKEILAYDKAQLAALQAQMRAQIEACAKSQFQADEPVKEEETKPIKWREWL